MKKCSNCGFDPDGDSLVAEGAPCGVTENGSTCLSYTCCDKTWKEHCKRRHRKYYNDTLSVHAVLLRKLRYKLIRLSHKLIVLGMRF
jgi:hypothetical protein